MLAALAVVALAGCAGKSPSSATSSGYKVGKPYQIAGVWYYPHVDYEYDETGIASWYGPGFHGKKTASGETYDQNGLTAAHRTLPLPSLVRVTNLVNGRQITLKVNDRGPFAHGRILDVSRRGAQLLDFEKTGTAKVRVEILAEESRQLAYQAGAYKVAPEVTERDRRLDNFRPVGQSPGGRCPCRRSGAGTASATAGRPGGGAKSQSTGNQAGAAGDAHRGQSARGSAGP